MSTSGLLNEIYVYPVKSLAGIKVEQWPVTPTGLKFDRKWMLVNSKNRFLSQRQLPSMVLVRTAITQDHLVLSAPGMTDLNIPFEQAEEQLEVTIWQDKCIANHVSYEADEWLSSFLNYECKLVRHNDLYIRNVDRAYASERDQTAFSDGFPFLIISENSLAALNKEMNLDLPMLRFRPNLVIANCRSYEEDSWRKITLGSITFSLPKPCSRCKITTIDIESAEVGQEPLKTLNKTRKWNKNVYFGQNAIHLNEGILSTGDKLNILEIGGFQPPR